MSDQPGRDLPDLSRADAARLSSLWPRGRSVGAGPWLPGELGDILRHQLSVPLEGGPGAGAHGAVETCGDLLLRQANPAVADLRRLKQWAKPRMTGPDDDMPREVAGVLYFAAILAARLRLGERISEIADERLRQAARWALQLSWLNAEMAALFRAGLELLAKPAAIPSCRPT